MLNTTNKQEKRTKIKFQAIRVSDKPCSTVFQCRAYTLRRSFFLFCALLFLLLTIVVLPIKQIELNFLTTKIIFYKYIHYFVGNRGFVKTAGRNTFIMIINFIKF